MGFLQTPTVYILSSQVPNAIMVSSEGCLSSSRKKPRLSSVWKICDAAIFSKIHVGDHVFCREKSFSRPGRRGRLIRQEHATGWIVEFSETQEREVILQKHIIPIYHPSGIQSCVILISSETDIYRQLALSQIQSTDRVLEIGCSTGKASGIIWKKSSSWIGLDTSTEMIDATNAKLKDMDPMKSNCRTHCQRLDPLVDPHSAREAITAFQATTSVVFIDIGGRREATGVIRMLDWVIESFRGTPLIVVKSKALYSTLRSKADDYGVVRCGWEWFETNRREACMTKLKHPLQAPKVLTPHYPFLPVCRYHNYHAKGCLKGSECPFDHNHCHLCLKVGHTARTCGRDAIGVSDADQK